MQERLINKKFTPRHSFFAFLTFVCGVTSLFPLYGLVFAVAGLLFGIFELWRIHRRRAPRAFALVVGGIVLSVLTTLVYLTLFFRAFSLMG